MAIVTVQSKENLKQEITAGKHTLIADEPIDAGGTDQGPDPYSLLLAALGACTSMTLKLYSRNKNWDLQNVTVKLTIEKIHAKDCEECQTKEGKIDRITREIKLEGNLSDEQRARLREIAKRCPVHRTLTSEVNIVDV
ncbi:MAG TPA: OsmC family protein [Acidobacteriota bacterium]|jgi:putative redox protein|nr:OsmC family protein [Acidobacteriota bacterium]